MKFFGWQIVRASRLQEIYNKGFGDGMFLRNTSLKHILEDVKILDKNTWDKNISKKIIKELRQLIG